MCVSEWPGASDCRLSRVRMRRAQIEDRSALDAVCWGLHFARQRLGHECITRNNKATLQFAETAISVSVYVFLLQKIQFPFAIRTWTSLSNNLRFITVLAALWNEFPAVNSTFKWKTSLKNGNSGKHCIRYGLPGRGAEQQHVCWADCCSLDCSSIPGQERAVFPWAQLSSAPGTAPQVMREAAGSSSGVQWATFSLMSTEEMWDWKSLSNKHRLNMNINIINVCLKMTMMPWLSDGMKEIELFRF